VSVGRGEQSVERSPPHRNDFGVFRPVFQGQGFVRRHLQAGQAVEAARLGGAVGGAGAWAEVAWQGLEDVHEDGGPSLFGQGLFGQGLFGQGLFGQGLFGQGRHCGFVRGIVHGRCLLCGFSLQEVGRT